MTSTPLTERLRLKTFDDIIGQHHLLGADYPRRVAFESGEPHSMVLWGPPGIKDIRIAVERAQVIRPNTGRRTILFVDEAHCFNKAVKLRINQLLRRVIVRISGLPHCWVGAKHA